MVVDNIYEHVSDMNKPLTIAQIKRSALRRARNAMEERDVAKALFILQGAADKIARIEGKP